MPMEARQVALHFARRERQAGTAARWFEALHRRCAEARRAVEDQRRRAAEALAAACLPALDPEALVRCRRLSGYEGFVDCDPHRGLLLERRRLERSVARVEADPRWQAREHTTSTAEANAEARRETLEMLAPWEEECARFERLDGFQTLLGCGYGTADFALRWWQPEHWSAVRLAESLARSLGMADFDDELLPAWRHAEAQRAWWRRTLAELDAELEILRALEAERAAALERLAGLEDAILAEARTRLAEHLVDADAASLARRLDDEAGDASDTVEVRRALRRLACVEARARFLAELEHDGLEPLIAELRARAGTWAESASAARGAARRRARISDAALAPDFDAEFKRHDARRRRLEAMIDTLERFDDSDPFALGNPWRLWWIEIFGEARPPRALPRTRRWLKRHPEARPLREALAPALDDPAPTPALEDEVGAAPATRSAALPPDEDDEAFEPEGAATSPSEDDADEDEAPTDPDRPHLPRAPEARHRRSQLDVLRLFDPPDEEEP
jgi:hypothetical protein